jgi:hypothetical protein
VVVAEEVAVALDERTQPDRAPAITSGKPTISSFSNLASSQLMFSQVCHEDKNTARPSVLRVQLRAANSM